MGTAMVGLTLAILAGFGVLLVASPAAYGFLLMEDTPVEWLGFYCLVAASFAFLARARRYPGHEAASCLALAALCAFIAGEEISWGQRILGYLPPPFFLFRNAQGELNVHNLAVPWMRFRSAAVAFSLVYGVLLPLGGRRVARWGIPLPPRGAALTFLAAASLFTLPVTQTDDEVGELLFAVGMLGAALETRPRPERRRSGLQLAVLLPLLSMLTSWASYQSPVERAHLLHVGSLQAGQAFEGLGRWAEAAAQYERLARYWGSDWDLWVKVVALYRRGGDYRRAYDVACELVRIHRREPRLFEALLALGDSLGIPDDARARIRAEAEASWAEEPSTPDDEEDRAFLQELVSRLDSLAVPRHLPSSQGSRSGTTGKR